MQVPVDVVDALQKRPNICKGHGVCHASFYTHVRFINEAPSVTEYKSLYNTTAKSKTISAPLG